MTHMLRGLLVAGLIAGATVVAHSQQPAQQPAQQPVQPPAQAPGTPPAAPPAPGQTVPAPGQTAPPPAGQPAAVPVPVPPVSATPTGPLATRTFSGPCGLLLQPVRPERTADFEQFLDYVRDALARSASPRVRSQAAGWRFFKAAETGPNATALYVFIVDPAIPGGEYSLGPLLSEAYTDPAQLTEIWTLYTASVTSGGTLVNLTPVPLNPPQPILTPPANQVPGANPVAPVPPATAKPLPNVVVKC